MTSSSSICVPSHNSQPPNVAFGVEFGKIPRDPGTVYDIDNDELQDALRKGDLTYEQATQCPILIKASSDVAIVGVFCDEHPENNNEPAIELYCFEGSSPIKAHVATHEGKHLSDYLNIGDEAFVSEIDKIKRKTVAALISVGGVTIFYNKMGILPVESISDWGDIAKVGLFTAHADVCLNMGLLLEYFARKEERRARANESNGSNKNLLIGVEPGNQGRLKRTLQVLRSYVMDLLIPDFGH